MSELGYQCYYFVCFFPHYRAEHVYHYSCTAFLLFVLLLIYHPINAMKAAVMAEDTKFTWLLVRILSPDMTDTFELD